MLIVPSDRERWLARSAQYLALGSEVLYHGTRYMGAILKAGALMPAPVGDTAVFFTRSAEEAAYWSMVPRDDDEGRGAIFVLQRDRVRSRFRVEPCCPDEDRDEYEERVWGRCVELQHVLIGIASEPIEGREKVRRDRSRTHTETIFNFNGWLYY